jgi:hypothetical protein
VLPKIDLHREPGALDRAVQIASTSELDMAADRLQRGAATEGRARGILSWCNRQDMVSAGRRDAETRVIMTVLFSFLIKRHVKGVRPI